MSAASRAEIPLLDPATLPLVGTSFIEASAGTGKTYALTTLYVRFVVERGLLPSEILVVTFTNAATAELRERIRERLCEVLDAEVDEARRARLRTALRRFDEAAIFTIHGFCQRTLAENAFESGLAFETQLLEKPDVVQATLAHDLASRLFAEEPSAFRAWLAVGAGKRWALEPEALARWLANELGGDDEMPLLPEATEALASGADLEVLCETTEAAWSRFVSLWRERGEELVELLCASSSSLNRNSYKVATIREKWIAELNAACLAFESAPSAAMRAVGPASERITKSLTREAIAKGMTQRKPPLVHPIFDAASELAAATTALSHAFDRRALALRRRFVEAAREAAAKRREQQHLLFFDDLIGELRRSVRGPRGERLVATLRARHRVALIDEFQDTDAVQYEIFKTVWHGDAAAGAGGALILIGDPKQAIYAFRGADVETYLAARGDAGEGVRSLGVNHRSDPGLIAAVNALFAAACEPFVHSEIGFRAVAAAEGRDRPCYASPDRFAPGLRVAFLERGAAGASKSISLRFARTVWMESLAADVAELLESGATIGGRPLRPSDVAILARRKSELDAARRALEALGIPCVSRGDGNVFDAREAWELACVLAAWLHPGDPARLRAALATGAQGFDAAALLQFSDESSEIGVWAERYADYGRLWLQQGFARAFESWRLREGVSERLLGLADGDRRLTNWLHLAELLGRIEMQRGASRSGLLAWLERAIGDPALRIELGAEASLLRLERDDEAVSLVTLHGSKGLEYEIVYLPCLWENFESRDAPKSGGSADVDAGGGTDSGAGADGRGGAESGDGDEGGERRGSPSSAKERRRRPAIRFFDPVTQRRSIDLGDLSCDYEGHVALAQAEREAEFRRLLYVAATRARRHCVIHWGCVGAGFAKSPLARFVLDARARAESIAPKDFPKFAGGLSDADWLEAWHALAAQAPAGAIRIERSRLGSRPRWQTTADAPTALAFEPAAKLALRPLATTSFTALVRAASRAGAPATGPHATGRDVDAEIESGVGGAVVGEAVVDASSDASSGASSDAASEAAHATPPEPTPSIPDLAAEMHLFPRGADAGTLLHEVLERIDLGRSTDPEIEALALHWSARGNLASSAVPQVVHVVRSVARTPLRSAPTPLRLGELLPGQLLPELEFTLAAPGDDRGRGFSAEGLAGILADSPPGSPLARYAERVRSLSWPALFGHLRGFIDAVFCDGERYYVVDYKSNHLGDRQEDYRPERLARAMIDHDYVLQSLLYCVALDRHLAQRLADYDYDRHFGGSYYLFLRGLAEAHAPGCGVFFDRPESAIVRRVSALLGAIEAEAGR